MSDPLLRAWKVVANPNASEAQWLSACRVIGDKEPPMAVLTAEGICGLLTASERNRRLYLSIALLTGRLGAFILDGFIIGLLLIPVAYCWLLAAYPGLLNYFDLRYLVAESFISALLEQFAMLSTLLASITLLHFSFFGLESLLATPIFIPITTFLSLIYHVSFQTSPMQGTPGERLFGLKVTDRSGRTLTASRSAARYFARLLCPLSLGFAFFLPIINRNQNSIEDIVSGSRVKSIDEENMKKQELNLFPYCSETNEYFT